MAKLKLSGSEAEALLSHWVMNQTPHASDFYTAQVRKVLKLKSTIQDLGLEVPEVPFGTSQGNFTFIDLFAGIGGMRLGFQNSGGKCVFSSEWDRSAQISYAANFGSVPFGDITKISASSIPDHDVLLAGFPCQAFSIAGQRAGFADTRGTMFFHVERVLKKKMPQAFLLENVKGLTHHDSGRTLEVILKILREKLKYFVVEPQVLNSYKFDVPQNRERIYIVGFRNREAFEHFTYPEGDEPTIGISRILENGPMSPRTRVSEKYFISQTLLDTLQAHKQRHERRGNGFGMRVLGKDDIAGALVVGGMGLERNLIRDTKKPSPSQVSRRRGPVNTEHIRRLTPREAARLQGFPDEFEIVVADSPAYKQFGNSVTVHVIEAIAGAMVKALDYSPGPSK